MDKFHEVAKDLMHKAAKETWLSAWLVKGN